MFVREDRNTRLWKSRTSQLPGIVIAAMVLALLVPVIVSGETSSPPLAVSHVGADAIYLNGGRSHGLEVGQHVAVHRDGEPIAELQIAFVSKNSSSCRLIESRLQVLLGDPVVPIPLSPEEPVQPVVASATEQAPEKPEKSRSSRQSSVARNFGNLSGTISTRWHQYTDGGEVPRDSQQATLRLNLRARSQEEGPFEARIRIRGQEDRRYRPSEPTDTERRDRLYELALEYAPPDGRVNLQLGRLSSSPLLGFDYLDGLLTEVELKPRFAIGGFYGQRSEVDEIDLGTSGLAYGAFFHYQRKRSRESPLSADIMIGGIREFREGEVSREYISLYARTGSGSRWSFYQRADIDINGAWRREASDQQYQVSNLLTNANYRFSESLRVGLSYDRRRRFRDFENRDTPEEIFDDRLREGFRVTAQVGDPKGWRLTSSVGLRKQEETDEDAYTATGSIFHTNIGNHNILVGIDFSGFTGETSEGYRASLRGRKYFGKGHDLGVTVGMATTTDQISIVPVERESQWIRLNGTARLPNRFFFLGEFELTEGDDLAGERLILQLGYRL